MYNHIDILMRDEKEERSKQGQTNNKAKQHSTPKAVTFPKENELPRVGLEHVHREHREGEGLYIPGYCTSSDGGSCWPVQSAFHSH